MAKFITKEKGIPVLHWDCRLVIFRLTRYLVKCGPSPVMRY